MAKEPPRQEQQDLTDAPPAAEWRRFLRYCLVLLLVGAVILVWVSLLTYSRTDAPSGEVYPPQRTVNNAVGTVGAHLAFTLRYWFGGGIYMALLFATVAAALMLMGGRIGDLGWRVIGLAILVTGTSVSVYLLSPCTADELTSGSAGVLGMGLGEMLLSRFAPVGAWLLVGIAMCIGMMLAADNLVLKIPALSKKVWDRRAQFRTAVRSLRTWRLPSARADGESDGEGSAEPAPATVSATIAPPKRVRRGGRGAADDGETPSESAKTVGGILALPRIRMGDQTFAAEQGPVSATAPARRTKSPTPPADKKSEYTPPPIDLLIEPSGGYIESQELQCEQKRLILQQTLNDFTVAAKVVGYMTGPVITLFELSLSPGVKVSQVASLANDIARSLAVPGVRIVSPIPGKDTIGIEVPNHDKEIVRIKELMQMAPQAARRMYLPLYLGKDGGGGPIVEDLVGMPHLLIAGTTGSGKSVCINSIVMSLLLTRSPQQVRFVLVDPKMVEMAAFENMPHLLSPVINDMRKAEDVLEWAATKMDERYELLKEAGVRNIAGFNALDPAVILEKFGADTDEDRARIVTRLPYYVIIVDELADLMMTSGKEVETYIIRLAQKSRAVGIHLVLATQRPSVNVVTGLIKSNMPCRASFRVSSRQESRIVLDQNGADVLLGRGDMLFLKPGTSDLIRAQGTFVADSEIRSVVGSLRNLGQPQYNDELVKLNCRSLGDGAAQRDELFNQAVEIVLVTKRGSVSLLQRRLQVGYSRASRIIDQMADAGLLGEYKGSQARECLITLDEWEELKAGIEADQSGESSANGEPTSV